MEKELTRRQKEFLHQFLDFYHENKSPIHYISLAKHLGIGFVTAYEMLRLLEKKGLVEAQYQLPSRNRGPGRAEVFFHPTQEAIRLFRNLSGEFIDEKSWEFTKQQILSQLNSKDMKIYQTLLNDLLVRIPERRSPILFMTEMITAIILTLSSIQKTAEGKGLIKRLNQFGFPGEIGLIILAGIGTVLSTFEEVNLKLSTFLFEQVEKYQEIFTQLNDEKRAQLTDFAHQAFKIVMR